MRLEIVRAKDVGYSILLDGGFFRYCKTYSELNLTVCSLMKSKYLENAEGFC